MNKREKIISVLIVSLVLIFSVYSITAQPVPDRLKGRILFNASPIPQPIDQAKVVLFEAIKSGDTHLPGKAKYHAYTGPDGRFTLENAEGNRTYFIRVFIGKKLLLQRKLNPESNEIQQVSESKIMVRFTNHKQDLNRIIVDL